MLKFPQSQDLVVSLHGLFTITFHEATFFAFSCEV